MPTTSLSSPAFDARNIERPDSLLFRYYVWIALLTGPLSPIAFLSLWFRYSTLRYKFTEDGVSMSWGVFFKQEVYLTYRRIQDIHLTRNLLQRWMGLAKISLQTASGSAKSEMAIEGILQAQELRDFLYSKMRGARNESLGKHAVVGTAISASPAEQVDSSENDRAIKALEEIRDALKVLVEKSGVQ